jgi:hypothetical protein
MQSWQAVARPRAVIRSIGGQQFSQRGIDAWSAGGIMPARIFRKRSHAAGLVRYPTGRVRRARRRLTEAAE